MTDDKKPAVPNYPPGKPKDESPFKETPSTTTPPKAERITTSEPVERKKSLGKRIIESFTGDDIESVGQYLVLEVLVPAAKTAISDAVSQGIERILFGAATPRTPTRSLSGTPRVSYNQYSNIPRTREREREVAPRQMSRPARATHDFREIVLESRGEADVVLARLVERIGLYDAASVADLYDMVGITGQFTDARWGWTSLKDARVVRVREGFLLDFPQPIPLD